MSAAPAPAPAPAPARAATAHAPAAAAPTAAGPAPARAAVVAPYARPIVDGGGEPSVRECLEEVQTAAEDVLAFAAGLDEAGLLTLPETDRRTYRALRDALTEIGEKVGELPPDLLARHPDVDWRGWAGLRDVVPHRHFVMALHRLRPAVADELPALLAAVGAELAHGGDGRADGQTSGAG